MKVKIEISKEYDPAYAVIYTKTVTDEIQRITELLEQETGPVTVFQEDRIIVLKPEDIYMIRVEDEKTIIYCEDGQYRSRKRLKEVFAQVGDSFMQIE